MALQEVAEESPILVKEIELQTQIALSQKTETSTIKKQEAQTVLHEPKVAQSPIQKISYKNENENCIKPTTVKAGLVQVAPKSTSNITKPQKTPVEILAETQKVNTPKINTKPVENPKLAECYFIRALQKYILHS